MDENSKQSFVLNGALTSLKGSASIHLPPNACKALEQLGILSIAEQLGFQLEDITLLSYADGSTLRSMKLLPEMLDKYKKPYIATHRATFHEALVKAAESQGVQIEMGSIVSSIDFKAPSVHLQDGRVFTGDLVLGSDGAVSQTRSLLSGRPHLPHHFGHMLFSCEIPQEALRGQDDLRDLVDSPGVPYWLGPGTLCLANGIRENDSFNLLGGIAEPLTTKLQTHP
jgi:2-polyprenyl-6-methoxyphenol hydroxylase-like FAD-dependent oxidoreductase